LVKQDIHTTFKRLRTKNELDQEILAPAWEQEYQPLESVKSEWYENLMSPITATKISQLPQNKAPGPSGVTYELFQCIDNTSTIEYILTMLNHMIQHQTTPKYLNQGTIILLPKTDTYTGDKAKLRPITLLEALKKILTTVMNQRPTKILDTHKIIQGNNFGFQKGKSTHDNVTIIRHLLDIAHVEERPLLFANLDIEKYYDTQHCPILGS
jgi:hypothetical protein